MSNGTLKQAYKTIDDVMQEVALDEEKSLEIICTKLQEENSKVKSQAIDKIIEILRLWGKIPVSEIKKKVFALSNDD